LTAERSYDEFYAACSAALVGQLYLLTGDREEARDCVQEALERAWLSWDRVSSAEDPQAWVRTVARRLAISRWRRVRNAATAWTRREDAVTAADHATVSTQALVLVDALQQLPVDQRVAVVLHYLCDLDVAAVARETGATPSAVKSRLFRGRRALGVLLGEEPPAPEQHLRSAPAWGVSGERPIA
jgi:RNA polymerase sigma-70 factor (ECF subfamily)